MDVNKGGYMRKKISSALASSKRTILPFFDSLNDYFKNLTAGRSVRRNNKVTEGLKFWENCDESDCEYCLLGKYQEWTSAYKGVNDLCDLIEKHEEGKLKKNKRVDMLDSRVILPGNFEN
jgi:hypothetical protein